MNKNIRPRVLSWSSFSALLFAMFVMQNVLAEIPSNAEFVEDIPPPPPIDYGSDDYDEDTLEPEITIIQRDDAIIEEHRVGGKLYMVKITPVIGKPYYLIDQNGDGLFVTHRSALYDNLTVPQWVLFSW